MTIIINCDKKLLQSVTGVKQCDRCYKVWQKVILRYNRYYKVLQSVITKYERYYKVWKLLQSETIRNLCRVSRFKFKIKYWIYFYVIGFKICVPCVVKKLVLLMQIVIIILHQARKMFKNFSTIVEAFWKTLILMWSKHIFTDKR